MRCGRAGADGPPAGGAESGAVPSQEPSLLPPHHSAGVRGALTRRLVAAADRQLLNYALGIWFVLVSGPTLKFFPPLSLVGGIPAQYPTST